MIKLRFPYNARLIEELKEGLPPGSRKWNPVERCWEISPDVAETGAKIIGRHYPPIAKEILNHPDVIRAKDIMKLSVAGNIEEDIIIPNLGGNLMPFQKVAVKFIEETKGRTYIADAMGLGKTIEALAWLQLHRELRPVIIISPASVKYNWQRHCLSWLQPQPVIHVCQSKNDKIPVEATIIITNYDLLDLEVLEVEDKKKVKVKGTLEEIINLKPRVVVIDECHAIKNNSARRTLAVKQIAKNAPYVLALSGTPIPNRPIELFNILKILRPKDFGNWKRFVERYCDGHQELIPRVGRVWKVDGASNQKELMARLRQFMIRREKEDVLKELPPKRILTTYITLDPAIQKEYEKAEHDCLSFIIQMKEREAIAAQLSEEKREEINWKTEQKYLRAEHLVRINTLRTLLARGKIKSSLEWLDDFVASNGKLVVFAHHLEVVNAICEHFKDKAVKVIGDISPKDRQKVIDRFQNDPSIRLFVATTQAGGEGITLTAAQDVVFIEREWVPKDEEQAMDRVHRIGQTGQVTVWYLVVPNTLDEYFEEVLAGKKDVIEAILSNKEVTRALKNTVVIKEKVDKRDTKTYTKAEKIKRPEVGIIIGESSKELKLRIPATTEEQKRILEAVEYLLSVCDGAHALDMSGFNKMDSPIVRELYADYQSSGGWTEKQWDTARKRIKKYKRQIGWIMDRKMEEEVSLVTK